MGFAFTALNDTFVECTPKMMTIPNHAKEPVFILLLRNLYLATYKVNEQSIESDIILFIWFSVSYCIASLNRDLPFAGPMNVAC